LQRGELTQAHAARSAPGDLQPLPNTLEVPAARSDVLRIKATLRRRRPSSPDRAGSTSPREANARQRSCGAVYPPSSCTGKKGSSTTLCGSECLEDIDLLLDAEILKGYHLSSDDPEQARRIFHAARQRAVGVNDAYHEAVALNDLGWMSMLKSGSMKPSRGLNRRSIREAGWRPSGDCQCPQQPVICYSQLGAFEQAVERRRQALDWFGTARLRQCAAICSQAWDEHTNSQK